MEKSFKLFFNTKAGGKSIHRITTKCSSFEEFTNKLQTLYPNYHPELEMKYEDNEGDKVKVTSEIEWQEMFKAVPSTSLIKLWVDEGKGVYFKDSSPPVSKQFYVSSEKESSSKEDEDVTYAPEILERIKKAVPDYLQSLFKGNKILPYNLPVWLGGVVKIINLPNNEVDLDINVEQLVNALNKRGIDLLQNKEFEKGRECFKNMLSLIPTYTVAMYNLACSESLLGNVKEGLEALQKAIYECGFKDLKLLKTDEDLKNLRSNPIYQTLVSFLEKSGSDKQEPKVDVPQVVPQEVVVPQVVPQEVIAPQVVPSKYTLQHKLLCEIGYSDKTKNLVLLEKFKGFVDEVVMHILENGY